MIVAHEIQRHRRAHVDGRAPRSDLAHLFIMQGAMIGITGTILGMLTGYAFCYLHANRIPLDRPRRIDLRPQLRALQSETTQDGIWIAGAAIGVSLLTPPSTPRETPPESHQTKF